MSKKVLSSIIGQAIIMSSVQIWAFLWVRRQSWYTPPTNSKPNGDNLEATNYENTALFLVSSFQYVLVAAVFSIGPPYRKPMYMNGAWCGKVHEVFVDIIVVWLMLSIGVLLLFNMMILLSPPAPVSSALGLVAVPTSGRMVMAIAVVINAVLSVVYEDWGAQQIAKIVGMWYGWRRRVREGKVYKAVEGGLRSR